MQFVKPSQYSAHLLLYKVEVEEGAEAGEVVWLLHFPENIVKPTKKIWAEEVEMAGMVRVAVEMEC